MVDKKPTYREKDDAHTVWEKGFKEGGIGDTPDEGCWAAALAGSKKWSGAICLCGGSVGHFSW